MTDFEKVSDWKRDGHENAIHFLDNELECAFTFHQGRYVSRVKKLAEAHDEVKIIYENPDGSIVGRMPTKWAVKLTAPPQQTEEQKKAAGERLRKLRAVSSKS